MTPPLPRTAVHRIACAIVAAEVRRLRASGQPAPRTDDWPDALPIGEQGLGLDSLEQLGALGALAETFGLDDAALPEESPQSVGDWIDWIMHRHGSEGGTLTVMTSGSTGRPLPCSHGSAELMAEAQVLATHVPGRRRVVALVPAHHLYGIIWTALLPAVLDIAVVARTIGRPLDLTAGDLVVAVPEQWAALRRLTRIMPPDVIGISSAGPLDDALVADLLASGLSRLLDIYGSSETSGIAIRTCPATHYELLPRWHLVPHGESDWQLGDAHGACRDLPDHVERIGARSLRPIGRRDGAVQVGGHKVWPARVADLLQAVEGVAEAAVRLGPDGRLKAFIVPDGSGDPAALAARIERAAADRLSAPERPRSLRFGTALPRNMMGKLQDWA
ncbi:AMP-binding protein [Sphingomonas melonis]|uniref:4-coumarate--CoA ligase n=1 Tax=Sphingomonas melonis TaxID=152682 RepID=A0A7Y9K1R2_9SPHN|nr:AMP-binding protein [Sphingomonas melonis]NYD91248.1 4-coumarate--CoA ligase [Sphingomonas melonis]